MSGTSPYIDLPPDRWRSLLGRAAVFHATRIKLSTFYDMSRDGPVQVALRELEMWAQECSAEDVNDHELVARVVRGWDDVLTRTLNRQHVDQAARALLTDLQALVRRACSTDPFQRLFTSICTQAKALYGPAWRPAILRLLHIRSHPRGTTSYLDPYTVTATTPWPPDKSKPAVELQIFCDGFGPAAYAVLPILLTHECVCHVPARQDRAKNDSAFAEGLLDWAAYFFLDQWAGKLDPALAPAARWHAQQLRYLLTSRADTPEGWARVVGHAAAETLLAWFEDFCWLGPHESRLRVAKLAVELNQVDRPLHEKDYFVSQLASPIPPNLQLALKDWEAGGIDAATLLSIVSGEL